MCKIMVSMALGVAALHLVLCGSSGVKADDLTSAMAKAYNTNPRLLAERARLGAANEQVPQALSGWRPTVNVTGRFNHEYSDSVTAFTFSAGENTINSQSFSLELSQPLYRGGRTDNEIKSAEERVLASRAGLVAVEQQVLLETASAYFDVVRDQQVTQLNTNNEQVLMSQLQATQDRFEVGELTRTDVSQAEARLANAVAFRIEAEGNLAISRSAYESAVGEFPGTLDFPPAETMPEVLDPKSSQEMAQVRNPNLVAAVHLERAALYDISAAAGSLLPEVSLDSSIARAIDPNTFTDERDSFQVGITGRVPLYQSGAEYARVRELRMIAVQRRQESDQQRRIVRDTLFRSWENLVTARARILSFEASVSANEIALDGVNQEADVGARTILDVLDAEQELFEAKVNLVRVKRDEVVALYNLLAISGGMTARGLGLPVQHYDAGYHYSLVRDKWYGVNSNTSGGSLLDFNFDSLDLLEGNSLLDWMK